MVVSKFIASRATARVLLEALKHSSSSFSPLPSAFASPPSSSSLSSPSSLPSPSSSSPSSSLSPPLPSSSSVNVVAPCDFRKSNLTFQVQNNQITYQGLEIPSNVLEEIAADNTSYEIAIKNESTKSQTTKNRTTKNQTTKNQATKNQPKKYQATTNQTTTSQTTKNQIMELLPLTIPSHEGIVFRLAEPVNEPDVEGPILYLHNLKMHLTKGYTSCLTFPRQLAEAAQVRKGDNVLDMFFGLGYCTRAALEMGAAKVITFEMYNEVLQLARKNPWSPNLNDPRIVWQQRDVINSVALFFDELSRKKMKYNACIIDPAKKRVMEKVYTPRFLLSLSEFISPGARVAAYVPDGGIAKKFQDLRDQIITTFESTSKFKFQGNHQENNFIFCFERK